MATTNRQLIAKSNPEALETLATALRKTVEDLQPILLAVFEAFRRGDAGPSVAGITAQLFDRWCAESGTAPLSRILDEVSKRRATKTDTTQDFHLLLTDRNFPTDAADAVADELAMLARTGNWTLERIIETCRKLYGTAAKKMCAQTGHVLIARILLYRIGEDTGGDAFPQRISGKSLATALSPMVPGGPPREPALSLFDRVRSHEESFLPTVYRLGELDWWYLTADKRSALDSRHRANVAQLDDELNLAFMRAFRALDQFHFQDVDVDVWRNVYQHYMPSDERQRLGGFYTPDELVEVVLDSVGYTVATKDLANKKFIDLASGSGAFVVGALSRLLAHMQEYGIPDMPPGKQPDWLRDEHILRTVQKCLHAIDIHPFASFLTTLNVLFLVLPRYLNVKKRNPQFTFEPCIVAHDSLVTTPAEATVTLSLQTQMNGRVERAIRDANHYLELLKVHFDFVIGNPPWSGILKGPLAAIYDEHHKRRLKQVYPKVAHGKYDIYGLFMNRSLRALKDGGVFGLITQDTFMEKDWAKGLRRLLSSETTILILIDLNPFGQLFFHAMNTPAITIVRKGHAPENHEVQVVSITRDIDFAGLDETQRRARVLHLLADVLTRSEEKGKANREFFSAYHIPQERLRALATRRWNLAPTKTQPAPIPGAVSLAELLEPFQGVTPGGEGCLDIYLMEKEAAESLDLETQLVHPVVKGLDVTPYRCRKTGTVMLYPYKSTSEIPRPAFDLAAWRSKQKKIAQGLRTLNDALDFDHEIDEQERHYRGSGELDLATLRKLLTHRAGLGLVDYPRSAEYLAAHYGVLQNRIFKKKNIRDFNRRWYEFIWPRDISVMLARPKIISPRLARHVRFALDTIGIVPQDSCIALVPSDHTRVRWTSFCKEVANLLGINDAGLLAMKVVLAFLNSTRADTTLRTGRKPTPKGSYAITEDFLADIMIPPLNSKPDVQSLIDAVNKLRGADTTEQDQAQAEIDAIVNRLG